MNLESDFYISNNLQLNRLVDAIKASGLVALDTEFTRQKTYYPILSTIQVAIKNGAKKEKFLIDCLTPNLDLAEFFDIISNQKIIKILHSASQDLQIFYQANKKIPKQIFDTQVMANFCGLGFNVGYSNLVEKIFDKTINKDQQRSDWQRRPLSSKQIDYALLDVEFLHEIYEKFNAEIAQKNRQIWIEEELKNSVQKSLFKSQESLLKNFHLRGKTTKQILQIKSLLNWREELAQKKDVLRQYFLKDEDIEEIIIHGFAAKNYKKLDAKMIAQIEKILQSEFDHNTFYEHEVRMSAAQELLFDEIKILMEKIAKKENFMAQFLLTNLEIKKIILDKNNINQIVDGWRGELFGEQLKKIIF